MDERDKGIMEGQVQDRDAGVEERRRVSEITSELRRRANKDYVRAQARKVMIRRSTDLRDRAITSPIVLGIAGAVLGTVVARLFRSMTSGRREHLVEWEPLHAPREVDELHASGVVGELKGKAGELKDKAVDAAHDLKESVVDLKDRAKAGAVDLKDRAATRIVELKDRAVEGVEHLREKLPTSAEIRDRVGAAYRYTTVEQPALGATLAMGAGLALGMLLPVSRAEERVLGPARERAVENLGAIEDKVRDLADKLEDKLDPQRNQSASVPPAPLSTPPYTRH